ncbi:hypothetical protein [Methylobacterium sp. E-045]|uniref:hypothetical protein n=1 Tax=Methylobacterium sp. E-045 TaxID=2836575 RepID=UPI001FBBCEC3|nr:hypothetical protein [Methylobacterium sp. E-045]MCJ2131565.1 hypothetical protein [Methylobacterium sp. E-045]
MTDEPPPWREITTDEYAPRIFMDLGSSEAWIASSETLRLLLVRQHEGEFRLRLILREGVDLRWGPTADPNWRWDYAHGPEFALDAAEIWIERADGRRKRVDQMETRPQPW